jgi:hypothetical protein
MPLLNEQCRKAYGLAAASLRLRPLRTLLSDHFVNLLKYRSYQDQAEFHGLAKNYQEDGPARFGRAQ